MFDLRSVPQPNPIQKVRIFQGIVIAAMRLKRNENNGRTEYLRLTDAPRLVVALLCLPAWHFQERKEPLDSDLGDLGEILNVPMRRINAEDIRTPTSSIHEVLSFDVVVQILAGKLAIYSTVHLLSLLLILHPQSSCLPPHRHPPATSSSWAAGMQASPPPSLLPTPAAPT